jgi:hypothetical protein
MRDSESAGCGIAFVYGIAGALVVGVPTFLIAFYRSLSRHPDSPQAPLLAIFLFGPAGAFVGFIAGALFSQRRPRK